MEDPMKLIRKSVLNYTKSLSYQYWLLHGNPTDVKKALKSIIKLRKEEKEINNGR